MKLTPTIEHDRAAFLFALLAMRQARYQQVVGTPNA
jgi:hypothetical protein